MCVAGEELMDSMSGGGGSAGGSVPEIVVTAPRVGLVNSVVDAIDWSEVAPQALIGAGVGFLAGGVGTVLGGSVGASLSEIESQEGIDLVDAFELRNDMIAIPELGGAYFTLH